MKHIRFDYFVVAATLLLGVCSTGCKEEAPKGSVAAARAKPGPEESFELIVETFRRRVEDTPVGFVLHDSGGRSMMTGKNTVSAELIAPANDQEKYKAIITVDSQSSYSINRSKSGAENNTSRDQERNGSANLFAEDDEGSGQILDSELVSPSGAENESPRQEPEATKDIVAQRPNVRKRRYELVYDNGRWALVTPLDEKTEQSIQYAFDQALETQI
jgi:hypothetical protein